jgi:prepilin-type processing-associated H-X9-DG protein
MLFLVFADFWLSFLNPGRRENSRQTSCANNLKNYTAAMHGYVTDWQGVYPIRYMGVSSEVLDQTLNPGRPGWIYNAVRPYIKNQAIFTCALTPEKTRVYPLEPTATYVASYAYNYALFNNTGDADIDRYADTVMMWDSINNYFDEQANVGWSSDTRSIGDLKKVDIKATIRSATSRGGDVYNFCSKKEITGCFYGSPDDSELGKRVMWHNDNGNVAFADGHVAPSNFLKLKWDQLLVIDKKNPCYDKPVATCKLDL